jgi:hypothetical protein
MANGAQVRAIKSRTEISEIQLSGWGPDCPAWGHALVGVAIGTRSPLDARPIDRAG